jgi:hypothetical protein
LYYIDLWVNLSPEGEGERGVRLAAVQSTSLSSVQLAFAAEAAASAE